MATYSTAGLLEWRVNRPASKPVRTGKLNANYNLENCGSIHDSCICYIDSCVVFTDFLHLLMCRSSVALIHTSYSFVRCTYSCIAFIQALRVSFQVSATQLAASLTCASLWHVSSLRSPDKSALLRSRWVREQMYITSTTDSHKYSLI